MTLTRTTTATGPQQRVVWAIGAALGALLAYAGFVKLLAPGEFATEISNYRFLPELAPYLAALIPGVEVAIGVALIAAPVTWRRSAALAALPLLLAFSIAVGQALVRDINIACGCFAKDSSTISGLTLLRNLGLLAAAILVARGRFRAPVTRP